jgi:MoaA/NifB/PqqE/SkfB family radical SAM enzyme
MSSDVDLLAPGPVQQARLDLTSRCNLRCMYCAVSHPDYHGSDMSGAMVTRVVAMINALARHNRLDPIDLNGHGETTFVEGWSEICFALVERGIRVRLTSNFAKEFDENELAALASMDSINISIDSSDRKLLRSVRRRVDLRQILANMTHVRAAAVKLHRAPPNFGFLCGLYDKNTLNWDNFAEFAVASGVASVAIWSLTVHAGLDVPKEQRVCPLDELSDDELRPRISAVLRGLRLLERHGVSVNVQGGFVGALARRVGLDGKR